MSSVGSPSPVEWVVNLKGVSRKQWVLSKRFMSAEKVNTAPKESNATTAKYMMTVSVEEREMMDVTVSRHNCPFASGMARETR